MSQPTEPIQPIAHAIPWTCEACGASGVLGLVSIWWTRARRMECLISATLSEHQCALITGAVGLLAIRWDFPDSWHAETFPDETL